jgi:hypothetical protein
MSGVELMLLWCRLYRETSAYVIGRYSYIIHTLVLL